MSKLIHVAAVLLLVVSLPAPGQAAEPGWSPVIVATGPYREQLLSTPVEMRPYRPFHFYGNAVRRRYHRGSLAPSARDLYRPFSWGQNPPRYLGY